MRQPPADIDAWREAGVAALATGLLAAAAAAVAAEPPAVAVASATVIEPRAYGYSVGDVMTRRVRIAVPAGQVLDPQSVPQPGRRGRALELRSVALQTRIGGREHELLLEYQVFLAPAEVRTLEMPAFSLRFTGAPREQAVRVDAWPLSVAPLVAAEAPMRRGLGEMQADTEPPPIDTAAARLRLGIMAAVLCVLLGYLVHVYVGVPWWTRRHRPFGTAWQALRGLPRRPTPAERRDAYVQLHRALDLTAGEVLFAGGIERFLAAHPRFAVARAELPVFFERSRHEFFAGTGRGADAAEPAGTQPDDAAEAQADASWLRAFCRRCRDAERGAA